MLNHKGFDLWAEEYDSDVSASDQNNSYPFAGYRNVLNEIYYRVVSHGGKNVLDIGFGTGKLTAKLYEHGFTVYGQDFSPRMIELAQEKMPKAHLYCGDFTKGLVDDLKGNKYAAIIATYSLHHLTDVQKVDFLRRLEQLLEENGCIYIGDVAFRTREELEACKKEAGSAWDTDEIYFVFDELKQEFPKLEFEPFSDCSGLLTLHA